MKSVLLNCTDGIFNSRRTCPKASCNGGHAVKPPFALRHVVALTAGSPRFWLVCSVAAVLLALGLAAAYQTDMPKVSPNAPRVLSVALTTLHPAGDTVQDAKLDAPMPVDLYSFALNAFLVPLLDDAVPPRWTDVAVEFVCGSATTVMVDGQPMVPSQTIPVKAFTVRWMMDRCSPLGHQSVELSGGVELEVVRNDAGLSAVVTPDHLRIDSHMGRAWLLGPFTAETEMDTIAPIKWSKTAKP